MKKDWNKFRVLHVNFAKIWQKSRARKNHLLREHKRLFFLDASHHEVCFNNRAVFTENVLALHAVTFYIDEDLFVRSDKHSVRARAKNTKPHLVVICHRGLCLTCVMQAQIQVIFKENLPLSISIDSTDVIMDNVNMSS